jgi:hypothetical protein
MTDKVGHWLQGGALVVAIGLFYYTIKHGAQSNGQSPAQLATVPQPSEVDFGGAGSQPTIPGGGVTVGGSPFFLTYNYPPANGGTPPPTQSNGCCGCNGCKQTQHTKNSLSDTYQGTVPWQLHNLNIQNKGMN